ncbi:MAG: hypothetical protein NVSMB25_13340 [Thermoleophilaceae bacterium]
MTLLVGLAGVTTVVTSAILIAGMLGVRGRAPRALGALLVAVALIVGDEILLSLIHLLRPWAIVGSHAAVLAAALVWRRRSRAEHRSARAGWELSAQARASCSGRPELALLATAVAVVLGLQAFMAISVAPNEQDALGYHLPRAAYWLQQHTALQHQPGQLDDPELAAPPNGELLVAWTMALARTDRFVQLLQWIALVGLAATIYSIARLLRAPPPAAAWSAGLFVLMPEPLLQAATAQNDLLISLLLLAGGFFMARGIRDHNRVDLLLAALAVGLAAGTKLTVAMAAPALLAVAVAAVRAHRPPRRLLALAGVALAAAIAMFGSFNYVQNVIHTHSLTGFSGTPSGDFIRQSLPIDAGRVAWTLVEAPALPALPQTPARTIVRHLFGGLRGASFGPPEPPIRVEAFEDESAYGLVGLLVLVPATLLALVRRRRPAERVAATAVLVYFVAYTIGLGYTPEAARYLMPAAALAAALLWRTARPRRLAWTVLVVTLATVPGALLKDTNKPIVPDSSARTIFDRDRLSQQTIDPDLAPMAAPIRRLFARVGAHDGIGFLRQDAIRDYLLVGEPLKRRVVGFESREITPAALSAARVRGVFVGYSSQAPCRGPLCIPRPERFDIIPLGSGALFITQRGAGARAG